MPAPHCALVVEDDERNAADLSDILRTIDCEPEVARSKEEALGLLANRPPCVILLDLQIPRTKRGLKGESAVGISLLEDIRRLFGGRLRRDSWIPVIVISGHAGEIEDVVELMKLDADDLIQKPYEADDVAGKVRQALDRSGRASHLDCRTTAVVRTAPYAIDIPGKRQKRRTIVRIGGKQAKLRDGPLCALLRLLLGHARGESVPLIDFSGERQDQAAAYKAVDRLREDLSNVLDDPTRFIVNSQSTYTLSEDASLGEVNTEWLIALGNQTITDLARALEIARRP